MAPGQVSGCDLGHTLLARQHPLRGEARLDEEAMAVGGGIHSLHIKAEDHLQELTGSTKDLREVVSVLSGNRLQHVCLAYWLLYEIHQHTPI